MKNNIKIIILILTLSVINMSCGKISDEKINMELDSVDNTENNSCSANEIDETKQTVCVFDEYGIDSAEIYVESNNCYVLNKDFSDNLQHNNGYLTYEIEDEKTSKIGIDVSSEQGDIDWGKVKAAGIQFAMIRLGYRDKNELMLCTDKCFNYNMENAIDEGLDVGVYFESTGDFLPIDADYMIIKLRPYHEEICCPVAIKFEDDADINFNSPSDRDTDVDKSVQVWRNKIENAGYRPMIYGNGIKLGKDVVPKALSVDDYGYYWYADYRYSKNGIAPDYPYQFDMWQYDDEGNVNGIDGKVNLDIMICDNKKMYFNDCIQEELWKDNSTDEFIDYLRKCDWDNDGINEYRYWTNPFTEGFLFDIKDGELWVIKNGPLDVGNDGITEIEGKNWYYSFSGNRMKTYIFRRFDEKHIIRETICLQENYGKKIGKGWGYYNEDQCSFYYFCRAKGNSNFVEEYKKGNVKLIDEETFNEYVNENMMVGDNVITPQTEFETELFEMIKEFRNGERRAIIDNL